MSTPASIPIMKPTSECVAREENSAQDLTSPEYWDDRWRTIGQMTWKEALMRRRKDELLVRFIDELRMDSASICELGCAPGSTLGQLAKLRPGHSYSGVDYAPEGAEHARELLQAINVKGTVYCGDLRTLNLPERFDLVYSAGLVEHFADPIPIVQSHMRFCRPGGRVVILIPNYAAPIVQWFIRKLEPEALEDHNIDIMHADAVRTIVNKAGLHDAQVGFFGGPIIRSCCRNPTWLRSGYRTVARTWNMLASFLPCGFPWQETIWTVGSVAPEDSVK